MSINIGIIGLPQSGKTTIFNALTGGKADTAAHGVEGISPHIGTAKVPEPRLKVLDGILHPKKVVPAEAKYIDVGASVKALVQDKGIGGELLNQHLSVSSVPFPLTAYLTRRAAWMSGGTSIPSIWNLSSRTWPSWSTGWKNWR
jgi:hypothetical protein